MQPAEEKPTAHTIVEDVIGDIEKAVSGQQELTGYIQRMCPPTAFFTLVRDSNPGPNNTVEIRASRPYQDFILEGIAERANAMLHADGCLAKDQTFKASPPMHIILENSDGCKLERITKLLDHTLNKMPKEQQSAVSR